MYDNYFDLPGALLCARVVDSLDQVRTGLFENYVLSFSSTTHLLHALLNEYKLGIEQRQGLFLIWTIPCWTYCIRVVSEDNCELHGMFKIKVLPPEGRNN